MCDTKELYIVLHIYAMKWLIAQIHSTYWIDFDLSALWRQIVKYPSFLNFNSLYHDHTRCYRHFLIKSSLSHSLTLSLSLSLSVCLSHTPPHTHSALDLEFPFELLVSFRNKGYATI
uniref:Uncharacterized protein n=1 Tax=Nelumbo nucifera TaxID=4432 RepID=A0A822XM39_NELNU|nr:TPA_asm: hypothetical protein HUJ06_020061 [Nelumbo nucifera]